MKLDSRSRRGPAGQQSEATGSRDSTEATQDPLAAAGAFQDFTRDFAHVPTFTVTNLTSVKHAVHLISVPLFSCLESGS